MAENSQQTQSGRKKERIKEQQEEQKAEFEFAKRYCDKWLLTKPEIKMAGHFTKTSFCVSWTNENLLCGIQDTIFLWDTAGDPESASYTNLARADNQSERRLWFILSTRRVSYILIVLVLGQSLFKIISLLFTLIAFENDHATIGHSSKDLHIYRPWRRSKHGFQQNKNPIAPNSR